MSLKDEYVEKLKTQLDEWSADVDVLETKVKLGEIQASAGEAWKELKKGSDEAWEAIKHAIAEARKKFNE